MKAAIVTLCMLLIPSNAETDFKRACRNMPHQSAHISGNCLVLYQTQLNNRTGANSQCATLQNGRLALIFSKGQIDQLSALLDLTTPVWCGLARDQLDPNKWIQPRGSRTPNPPWDASIVPNPDPTGGDGVLVSGNGLRNADSGSLHPYLCQFPEESSAETRFQLRSRGEKASNEEAFDKWSVANIHICSRACRARAECASFAHSVMSFECHLYPVPAQGLALSSDTDYELFEKQATDEDCMTKTECAAHYILMISGNLNPNIESYHPGYPGDNRIVQTLDNYIVAPASELIDGRVLISGPTECLWVDPTQNYTVSAAPSMTGARNHHAHAKLNGAMVVCGGKSGPAFLGTCEQFTDNQWQPMASMTARFGLKMVNLDGRLYAAGGRTADDNDQVFERYDPQTTNWTRLNDLPEGRLYPGMAVFQDTIYICGGVAAYTSCKKYDVATDSWTSIGSLTLSDGRSKHEMIVYEDKMYVFGGNRLAGGTHLNSVEVYDHLTDSWSQTQSLIDTKVLFTAVVV